MKDNILSIRLDDTMLEWLVSVADINGITVSQVVRKLISDSIRKDKADD